MNRTDKMQNWLLLVL